MLKIRYAVCFGVSQTMSAQFTLEMCVAAQNLKKITKHFHFKGSRSFKIIDLNANRKGV